MANIKAAVEIVLKGPYERTLASVAAVCTEQFGGPKYQSICNSSGYRAYINARFAEARAATIVSRQGTPPPAEAEALIEVLQARVQFLAEENTRLKKAFRSLEPVPINKLLGKSGPGITNCPPTDSSMIGLSADEKRDLRAFLNSAFDMGFDNAPDGRLVTTRGLTVIGAAGMAVLRRLVGDE
ncbi:hypothetical protein [Azospirillum sp. sgz301742]